MNMRMKMKEWGLKMHMYTYPFLSTYNSWSNQSRDSTYMYILLFFLLFFALLRRVLCVSREDPLNLKGDCSSKQPWDSVQRFTIKRVVVGVFLGRAIFQIEMNRTQTPKSNYHTKINEPIQKVQIIVKHMYNKIVIQRELNYRKKLGWDVNCWLFIFINFCICS